MTLHNGTSAHSRMQQHGYRWLIRRATRTVACSPSAARSFGALVGREIPTIANGIDVPGFSPLDADRRTAILRGLGIPPDSLVIGAVGRMVEQKGYAYLIDAFSRLDQVFDRARLLMLGDGPLRNDLQRRARERGIGDRVCFAGFRSDVAQLLQVLDVIVFSSLYEGLSIALLEAMAAARCIVGTMAAGIADAVGDDREAVLVPVADAQQLAGAIGRALSSDELRHRLGRAAQRRFREEFTAERMVAKYERLYREALAEAAVGETMQAAATGGDLAAGSPGGRS
jgi:glycosyltransferase involved in cell wall biosynthesis